MGMQVGYARVSTGDQSLAVQLDQLQASGCERIYSEKRSGKSVEGRAELDAMLKFVREGDTIVVVRLDRLARSMLDFCTIIKDLNERGIGFRCLSQGIDTTGSTGKLTMQILMAVAEFELSIRAERQAEGIAKAKEEGRYKGRVPTARAKATEAQALLDQGIGPAEIARRVGVSRASVYRITTRKPESLGHE